MKTLNTSCNEVITSSEEFKRFLPSHYSTLLERSSSLIRRILQDMGQWADNTAHEKLLLRLSFDLLERFIEYCPTQLPGRPAFLLDGFIADYFAKPQETPASSASNPLLYRFLDGLLKRAVVSRDALICLFYHLYGMKPVEVSFLLGLEDGQTQRIYKNFARWRQSGWQQATEEVLLSSRDMQSLMEDQVSQPHSFDTEVRRHLETLLPFYRKSDPPYYPCLSLEKWQDMFREGYGFDYRMWHLPLCLSCMESIRALGDSFLLNPAIELNLQITPHSLKEEDSQRKSPGSNGWRTDRNSQTSRRTYQLNTQAVAGY